MHKTKTFKDCRLFDRNFPVAGSRDKYGRRKFENAERNLNRILQISENNSLRLLAKTSAAHHMADTKNELTKLKAAKKEMDNTQSD